MGIIADYTPLNLNNAYVKINRVWGSKEEGWNAWVGIYKNIKSSTFDVQIHIQTSYMECNPFVVLYEKVSELEYFKNVKHSDLIETPAVIGEDGSPVAVEHVRKKGTKKKV